MAVLLIDTVTVTVNVSLTVTRSQAGTADAVVVMLNGIVVLVAGDVFDFYTLPLTQTIVNGQADGRTIAVRGTLDNALDSGVVESLHRRLSLPRRCGGCLLDLCFHCAAFPLTFCLSCRKIDKDTDTFKLNYSRSSPLLLAVRTSCVPIGTILVCLPALGGVEAVTR